MSKYLFSFLVNIGHPIWETYHVLFVCLLSCTTEKEVVVFVCGTMRDFLLKVGLCKGIDMEVTSGIYDFLYATLLSQEQGLECC